MSVARPTFARSVSYTVTETRDLSGFDIRPRRRRRETQPVPASILAKRATRYAEQADAETVTECVGCRVEMQEFPSATRDLHYLICPRCKARFASNYEEVFRAGAGVRRQEAKAARRPEEAEKWRKLLERAEAFHRMVDDSDPYLVLGLDSRTPFPEVRAHYHELATRHHPDHGGDPVEMRRIINAFERIRAMVARRTAVQAPSE